jgi:hypothetical protein
MASRGLNADDEVTITSHFQGEKRSVNGFRVVPYDLPQGCTATYFPESNPLVPLEQIAHKSRTPASKSVTITVVCHRERSVAIQKN